MAADSKGSVLAALGGNTLIMLAKFGGFFFTGSGAMFAEAVHTLADVLNQGLLLLGIVRSGKEATDKYQYGYSQERFVWALISAVGIFFLGCGVTLMHGLDTLFSDEHEAPTQVGIAVGILVASLVIEGTVLVIAFRGLLKAAAGRPFFKYIKEQADPSAVAVLLEDAAACLGVLLALAAIGLTHLTGHAYWDSIGSILIALLLGAMAIWLAMRNKELLVGTSISRADAQRIRNAIRADATVERIADFKSKMLDTETFDVLVELDFHGEKLAQTFEPQLRAAYDAGFADWESFYAFEQKFADDIVELLGDKINEIEENVKRAVPEVKHIDVEID